MEGNWLRRGLFSWLFSINWLAKVANFCLAAYCSILLCYTLIRYIRSGRGGVLRAIFIIINKVSKIITLNNSFVDVHRDVLFLPRNDSMGEPISFLKFLVVRSALEGRFSVEE